MLNQNTAQTTEAPEAADLVPLALIAAEIGESVGWVAHRFGEAVVVDDVGMRAVPVDAARAFFTERREWKERFYANAKRRAAEQGRNKVRVKGVPAQDGMSPFESMLAAADQYVTPSQEFGPGWDLPPLSCWTSSWPRARGRWLRGDGELSSGRKASGEVHRRRASSGQAARGGTTHIGNRFAG
jgi:hypothetical protein